MHKPYTGKQALPLDEREVGSIQRSDPTLFPSQFFFRREVHRIVGQQSMVYTLRGRHQRLFCSQKFPSWRFLGWYRGHVGCVGQQPTPRWAVCNPCRGPGLAANDALGQAILGGITNALAYVGISLITATQPPASAVPFFLNGVFGLAFFSGILWLTPRKSVRDLLIHFQNS